MKRIVALLFIAFCLFSSPGVTAKSMACISGRTSTTIAYTNHNSDTCKMGVAMKKCCMARKYHKAGKNRHYGSVAAAFLAKLFPVLSDYVSTDTVIDEPCLYRLHA